MRYAPECCRGWGRLALALMAAAITLSCVGLLGALVVLACAEGAR